MKNKGSLLCLLAVMLCFAASAQDKALRLTPLEEYEDYSGESSDSCAKIMLVAKDLIVDFSGNAVVSCSRETGRYELLVSATGRTNTRVRIWSDEFDHIDMYLVDAEGNPIEPGMTYEATLGATTAPVVEPEPAPAVPEPTAPVVRRDQPSAPSPRKGDPVVRIRDRNVVGNIPRPNFSSRESGTVVVIVWIDSDGNVSRATASPESTTHNEELVAAAIEAALATKFNPASDSKQHGTISYAFNLK